MNTWKQTCTAILTAAATTLAAAAGGIPPRYHAIEFDILLDGVTTPSDLNNAGYTTGKSGGGAVNTSQHAYLGYSDGTIMSIETIPGTRSSEGQVINDHGVIAGVMRRQNGTYTLFYYTPEQGMVDIGSLGGTYGRVLDINEAGDVVGEWKTPTGQYHAFLYTTADGLIDLGTLGTYESHARDINENRQIVGDSWTDDWDVHAFLWEDGVMYDLGTGGGDWSSAYYINDQGVVVGESKDASGTMRAFRYDTSTDTMTLLPSPPDAQSCHATWIAGDSDLIIGWWVSNDGAANRAFYYTGAEGMVDMGLNLGSGWAMPPPVANQAGETLLVQLDDHTYETFGYLFDPATGVHDLNDLLAVAHPWSIVDVVGINEAGQILCVGMLRTLPWSQYAVLLTPITPGDLDADGDVDLGDLAQLLAGYGTTEGATYAQGDIDADGNVDLDDLAALLSVYGTGM